jgi:tight adherence protein B
MTLLLQGLLMFGVLIVAGVALSFALMRVRRTRREFERHVSLVSGTTERRGTADLADQTEANWRELLGRRARGAFAVGLPRRWGMTAGALSLLLSGIAGTGAVWLALHSGLHMPNWIALTAATAAFFLAPRALLKFQQNGADKKFMEIFPDTIDMVIRMLRAGLPITAAVRAVGEEAPPPANEVFTNLADKMAIGITFEDALSAAGQRIGLTDFRFFTVAITLQRATGGNLATTLDILSDLMRKRRAARLKAKATTGEVRMSAYVLGAIPLLIIGGLFVITPDYLQPLFIDPRGRIIIGVAAASMLIGFGAIRQMMRSVTSAT